MGAQASLGAEPGPQGLPCRDPSAWGWGLTQPEACITAARAKRASHSMGH